MVKWVKFWVFFTGAGTTVVKYIERFINDTLSISILQYLKNSCTSRVHLVLIVALKLSTYVLSMHKLCACVALPALSSFWKASSLSMSAWVIFPCSWLALTNNCCSCSCRYSSSFWSATRLSSRVLSSAVCSALPPIRSNRDLAMLFTWSPRSSKVASNCLN